LLPAAYLTGHFYKTSAQSIAEQKLNNLKTIFEVDDMAKKSKGVDTNKFKI
jgi:hypothetical protein